MSKEEVDGKRKYNRNWYQNTSEENPKNKRVWKKIMTKNVWRRQIKKEEYMKDNKKNQSNSTLKKKKKKKKRRKKPVENNELKSSDLDMVTNFIKG